MSLDRLLHVPLKNWGIWNKFCNQLHLMVLTLLLNDIRDYGAHIVGEEDHLKNGFQFYKFVY